MNGNTHLIHAIADALIEAHDEDATEWLECGGRAEVEGGVAGWCAAIVEGAWIDRPEDILVLRALRHIEHTVELAGGARIEARIRALVDEDWHGRRRSAKARIGEVFAHELLLGDNLRLRTVYLVEPVCPPAPSVVLAEKGLRGRLADVASNAVSNARTSDRWCVGPTEPIRVNRIEYDLDECTHVPVPAAWRAAPGRDSA